MTSEDPTSTKAILIKAEILYDMGLFEKSLSENYKVKSNCVLKLFIFIYIIIFQGQRLNPRFENNVFEAGIQLSLIL